MSAMRPTSGTFARFAYQERIHSTGLYCTCSGSQLAIVRTVVLTDCEKEANPLSQAVTEHRAAAQQSLRLAVLTVSDTRTPESDTSGALIVELALAAGHQILERSILPDEPAQIGPL